jgi:hypothetical protein
MMIMAGFLAVLCLFFMVMALMCARVAGNIPHPATDKPWEERKKAMDTSEEWGVGAMASIVLVAICFVAMLIVFGNALGPLTRPSVSLLQMVAG